MRKAANGQGTIHYSERKKLWHAKLTVDGARKSVYGKTQQEVLAKLEEARQAVRDGRPVPRQRLLVRQILAEWLDAKRPPATSVTTWAGYQRYVNTYLLSAWGDVRAARLTPAQVEKELNDKVRKGLSPRTAQHIKAILRSALSWAEAEGYVSRNVAMLAKGPRVLRPEVQPLSPDDADALTASLRGDPFEALYLVELALGLRPCELLGITWPDVDLAEGRVRLRHALHRIDGQFTLVDALKTTESRATMPLPSFVHEALVSYLGVQTNARERMRDLGVDWGNSWDLVFTTADGHPLHETTVYHDLQRRLRRLGIARRSLYALRHTSASLLIEDGAELVDVKDHLRHSQIALTVDTYTHLYEQRRRRTADLMNARLRRSGLNR